MRMKSAALAAAKDALSEDGAVSMIAKTAPALLAAANTLWERNKLICFVVYLFRLKIY